MKKNKSFKNLIIIFITYFLIKKTDFETFNLYYVISISILLTISYFKAKEIIVLINKWKNKSS